MNTLFSSTVFSEMVIDMISSESFVRSVGRSFVSVICCLALLIRFGLHGNGKTTLHWESATSWGFSA